MILSKSKTFCLFVNTYQFRIEYFTSSLTLVKHKTKMILVWGSSHSSPGLIMPLLFCLDWNFQQDYCFLWSGHSCWKEEQGKKRLTEITSPAILLLHLLPLLSPTVITIATCACNNHPMVPSTKTFSVSLLSWRCSRSDLDNDHTYFPSTLLNQMWLPLVSMLIFPNKLLKPPSKPIQMLSVFFQP